MGGTLKRFFERSPVIWSDLGEKLFTELFGAKDLKTRDDVLISDENACSYRDPVQVREHVKAFTELAKTWGFERVRILGSVRHQAARLASSYAQISDRRVGASQSDFEARMRRKIENYYKSGVTLDYARLRRALMGVIGSENVLLLPYELMKESLPDFLERWFQFLGRPEEGGRVTEEIEADSEDTKARNVRSSSEDTWALRERTLRGVKTIQLRPGRLFGALGLLTEVPLRWPDFEREDKIRLTPSLKWEIMNTYEESNRILAEHIEMDLGRYDYY